MERETGANKSGSGVRETRSVGVTSGPRGIGVTTEGVEWGFDAESPFASAALGGCFFGGGESHGAKRDEMSRVVGMGRNCTGEGAEEEETVERHVVEVWI